LDGVVTISQNGGENTFGVSYFKGGERQYWEIEISDFTNIVNQLSGRQVDRMRMIVDDGVPSSRGDQMISVIALPLDSSGNLIGQYNGVQLGLCGQYFPERDRANGARVMLQPPAPPNQIAEGDIPGRTYATSRR
jgi:hypothetical protein